MTDGGAASLRRGGQALNEADVGIEAPVALAGGADSRAIDHPMAATPRPRHFPQQAPHLPPESLMMRLVDDFLFVTTSR